MQFRQRVKAGEVGKTYTFAVFVKPLGASVPVHLENRKAVQSVGPCGEG
jgi:hypothetical protein